MPQAERLRLPEGYGSVKRMLAWEPVRARLVQALQYWAGTTRPDGRPHAVPLDGIWLDDVWYFGGSQETVTQRNLSINPHLVLHLPDPVQAVIVEGRAGRTATAPELAARLAATSREKYADYGYDMGPEAYAEVMALRPDRVLAWTEFPADATRFRFDGAP